MKMQKRIFSVLVASFLTLAVLITGCDPETQNQTAAREPGFLPNPASSPASDTGDEPVHVPSGTTLLAMSLGIQDSVDLRANDGPVMSQFGGTCSTFATAAVMNNILKSKGINKLVSERHLWSTYGVYDADAAVEAASENYLTEEKYWPVSGTKNVNYEDYASLKITHYKNLDYNLDAALKGLSQGHPLVMAVQVPHDLGNCEEMISATSPAGSGQHVMAAVGYQLDNSVAGGGYFILKNSWGADCGDHGYHYYPFQLCKRSDLYCYFIEVDNVEAI